MTDPLHVRAYDYIYKKIKKARIALGYAEHKNNAEHEISALKDNIEILEYLSELALREGGNHEG